MKFSDTRKEEVRLSGKRRITRGSGGWEFFLLLWLTGLKSSQDEEEPDPQDQAMQGQSLGVLPANYEDLYLGKKAVVRIWRPLKYRGEACWFLNKKI